MKKFITLLILSIFAVSEMNAEKIRRTWDFTKGFSETSIAMFNTDVTSGSGYWNTNSTGFESKARAAGPLVVKINGVDQVIPESVIAPTSSQDPEIVSLGDVGRAVPAGALKNIPVARPIPYWRYHFCGNLSELVQDRVYSRSC